MKIQEKMKRDWDRRAEADPYYWVAATQEADLESYHASAKRDCEHFIEGLAPLLQSGVKGPLLDLGCGIGRMTAPLAAHFDRVVGVDVSPLMIDRARELHAHTEGLEFVVNSGADLSVFEDQTFQVICSYSVLPHLPPDVVSAYFMEIGRVLKEQGLIRYQFWVGPSHHPDDHDTLGIHVYTESELSELHKSAGLVEVSREEINYFDPILKLKPLWINARREGSPLVIEGLVEREVSSELGDEERRLEYDLMLHLALRYTEQERRLDAEGVLERAIQLDRARPEAYLHWAELRMGQDDLKGAKLLLNEMTVHCPSVPQAWLLSAQFAVFEERYLEANEMLKTAASLALLEGSQEYELYRSLKREATQGHLASMKQRHKSQARPKGSKSKGKR